MPGKRALWHKAKHSIRDFIYAFSEKSRKGIIFDTPHYFHYLHVEPIILAIKDDPCYRVTIVKWQGFEDKYKLPGVKYICKDDVRKNLFSVYDCYITTEYYGICWWFGGDVLKIYLLHGVGPKASYIKNKQLNYYDYVFCPGPAVYKMQSEIVEKCKICKTGLPVTDTLLHNDGFKGEQYTFKDTSKPILLYAPSWSNNSEMISVDEDILYVLKEQPIYNIVIKPHPLLLDPERCEGKDWGACFSSVEGKNVIVYKETNTSIYEILRTADILLGDISSVIYEFMILERPVIIYAKENIFEYYGSMNEYRNLLEAVYKIKKPENLIDILKLLTFDKKDTMIEERKALLNKTFFALGNSVNATKNTLSNLLKHESQ